MKSEVLRVGNAQAFWGDSPSAAATLLSQEPGLDYLTLDYLAEVSLSIMAIQRERDPSAGFAQDFVSVLQSLVPHWQKGSKVRVVTNAGGLNPQACAKACMEVLRQAHCEHIKVAVISGDDVLSVLKTAPDSDSFNNLETKEPAASILDRSVTANAYLGSQLIVEALRAGADLVITGRVADPSLTAAPAIAHFEWSLEDYDRIAGATVAGHLIECGTQTTGGFSTNWLEVPDPAKIGFPIVEIHADGSCVVTKSLGSGGLISEETVKEQLLYEIGDPGAYLSPDVTVSLLGVSVKEEGPDRVRVSGARGQKPTSSYKVSATYRDGFKAHGTLTIFGRDAVRKARRCGELILDRLEKAGAKPQRSLVECLGTGASVAGVLPSVDESSLIETVLRISVADSRRDVVELFSKELASLITAGPQGITGYAAGRPKVQPVFGYWPCLISKTDVKPCLQIINP